MENKTWRINSETKDLCFDADGILEIISEQDAIAQNITLTIRAGKGDFDLVPAHGTEYEKIFGTTHDANGIDTVIREAIFQEPNIIAINNLGIDRIADRKIKIHFDCLLKNREEVGLEVVMD